MALKSYKPFLQLLTTQEQARMFDLIKKYNSILNKPADKLTRKEDEFIVFRPHDVNEWLTVDIIEREVVFIPNMNQYRRRLRVSRA